MERHQNRFDTIGTAAGGPLSLMLFNLAVDVFQRIVGANSLLDMPLSNRVRDSIVALQYADDTALIMSADVETLISFKLILRLFSSISGLEVNFRKSSFVPINVSPADTPLVRDILGCAQTTFPTVYLGMPLSIKRPTRDQFRPLIERVERRLETWQTKLISQGGRHQLEIGDGTKISYWYDAWGMGCLAEPGTRQINASLSLRDAVAANQDLITDHALVFTEQQDDLRWNWGPTYSAKSVYTLLMGGGRISWPFKQIWKQHIPPTVKIFTHLLLLDKMLTREVMMRRNFHCTAECEMCDGHEVESSFHLFFVCGYAMQVWNRVLPGTAISMLTLRDIVQDSWLASVPKTKEHVRSG
ncbi:uncharacterized protein LOC144553858 [Carex rostrata]